MMGIGNTAIRRVKAYSFILTVQVIKGTGSTTRRKVMAYGILNKEKRGLLGRQ
jgi:hypothetical protein